MPDGTQGGLEPVGGLSAAHGHEPPPCAECGLELTSENLGITLVNCLHVKCGPCHNKAKKADGTQLCYQCCVLSPVHNQVRIESFVTVPPATTGLVSSDSQGIGMNSGEYAAKPPNIVDNVDEEFLIAARARFENALKKCTLAKKSMQENMTAAQGHSRYGSTVPGKSDYRRDNTQSCVIRLFDRKVDIGQSNERSSLYETCRSWVLNNRQNLKKRNGHELAGGSGSRVSTAEENTLDGNVYQFAKPEPLPRDMYGNPVNLRIPAPLPQEKVDFDINYAEEQAPDIAELLRNHKARWALIRQSWKEARASNDARFKNSFENLEKIYIRANKNGNHEKAKDGAPATAGAGMQEMYKMSPLVDP